MPARLVDVSGQRFGFLVVTGRARGTSGAFGWTVRCDCGRDAWASGSALRKGAKRSCGCQHRRLQSEAKRSHGRSGTPIYRVYYAMVQRCTDAKARSYPRYGGRGIRVCERWLESFDAFLADVGDRPSPLHEIERIDNDGHYEPGNVTWATRTQQQRNTSRNRVVEADGRRMTLVEWSEATGIERTVISARLDRLGWSTERAVSEPVQSQRRSAS